MPWIHERFLNLLPVLKYKYEVRFFFQDVTAPSGNLFSSAAYPSFKLVN